MTGLSICLAQWAGKRTSDLQGRFKKICEWISFGVLGLNSFIMLYFHNINSEIRYVVCAGALGYTVVLSLQTFLFRHCPKHRMYLIRLSKKIFRLIYTAIYLTAIMLNIIAVSQIPNNISSMVYYGWLFIWVAIWGTNCLWKRKAFKIVTLLLQKVATNSCTKLKNDFSNNE